MMENVYFRAAKLTLDAITFACRDRTFFPLITAGGSQNIHTSAHRMQRHFSVLVSLSGTGSTAIFAGSPTG